MYISYLISTGEILFSFNNSPLEKDVTSDQGVLTVDDDLILDNYYVVSEVLTPRPKMSLVVGITTVAERELTRITGIPVGATANVFGNSLTVINDGEILFSFEEAATYLVTIELFPYVRSEVIYYVY